MKPYYRLLLHAFFIILASFYSTSLSAQSSIITYVMGGLLGYSGDGGPATAATVGGAVEHIAADPLGNFYITDPGNNNIRKVNSSGIVSTFAGNLTAAYGAEGIMATASSLNNPVGIAADKWGNVFVAELARVRKINPAGIITTFAGTGSCGSAGDGGPATSAHICGHLNLAVDKNRNVFIADVDNHKIRKVDSNGIITTIAGTGSNGFSGDGGPATAAQISSPWAIAVDDLGNLFFTEEYFNKVRKINSAGIISTFAGNGSATATGDGGPATAAGIERPKGIAVDSRGNLYIGATFGYTIRVVNTAGTITRFAGSGTMTYGGDGGPATAAGLFMPSGMAFDGCSNLYFCQVGIGERKINNILDLHAPTFIAGASIFDTICASTTSSLDTMLAINAVDAGTRFQWSIIGGPLHGTLSSVSYSAVSSGGTLTPSGFSYTPATGYTGYDTVKILAANCEVFDTATLYIKINPAPDAGSISGADSLCPGFSSTYTDTAPGGSWSVSNSSAMISWTGAATGVTEGIDTIFYSVTNTCGTATAAKTVVISPCPDRVINGVLDKSVLAVYPNPNNGSFTVMLSGNTFQKADLTITDVVGRNIKSFTACANQKVDINLNAAPGIYFVHAPALNKSVIINIR